MTDAKLAAAVVAAATGVVAVGPSPDVGFVLQGAGVGALIGGLVILVDALR